MKLIEAGKLGLFMKEKLSGTVVTARCRHRLAPLEKVAHLQNGDYIAFHVASYIYVGSRRISTTFYVAEKLSQSTFNVDT